MQKVLSARAKKIIKFNCLKHILLTRNPNHFPQNWTRTKTLRPSISPAAPPTSESN